MSLHCRAFCSALFWSLVFSLCGLEGLFLGTTLDAWLFVCLWAAANISLVCLFWFRTLLSPGPSDIGLHVCQLKAAPQFTPINLKLDTADCFVVEALRWGWHGLGFVGTTNWECAYCHCLSLMRKHVLNIIT